jgi:single-stranded-DNA-specific exonuclease
MSAFPTVVLRNADRAIAERLVAGGCHPLLARVYAARGIADALELDDAIERLLRPDDLHNAREMARILADAIEARAKLVIVADYDADGATACAVGIRALRAFGGDVDYFVPNRFEHGYGLTPEIVRCIHARGPADLLITVDNGIASNEGVAEANRLGMRVLVTDHHLPGATLPDAACIVNPNQPDCAFASKHLAGVGVIFYVMLALRAELRARRRPEREPNMAALLDLVALGTVADVVRLDGNNRLLVRQGLKRMRAGRMQPGIAALFAVAGRSPERAGAYDLGFALGPRLNAAGRLTDMSLGIEGLITDDPARAHAIALELDRLNRERRDIEAGMRDDAFAAIDAAPDEGVTLSMFNPAWHPGVVGIVASRLKDRVHRPVIAFAPGSNGEIRGSGRSIPGLHLRDALDLVAKRHPGLILKFGGHAAAAGVSVRESHFAVFREAFELTVRSLVSPADLERQVDCDGSLAADEATLGAAWAIADCVWGQGFPEPRFVDRFGVVEQRIVGGRHVRLKLARADRVYDGILFGDAAEVAPNIEAVYRLDLNEFNGTYALQLTIEHWRPRSAK